MQDVLSKAEQYFEYASNKCNAHYIECDTFRRNHYLLGVAVTATTAVVGTAIFASLAVEGQNITVQVTTGLISVAAAVFSALHTFLDYSTSSAKHRDAAVKYEAVRHQLDIFFLRYNNSQESTNRDNAISSLEVISKLLDDIAAESPSVRDVAYNLAVRNRKKQLIRKP